MEKLYDCSLADAAIMHSDDSRIADTSLISKDLINKVEIKDEDKIYAKDASANTIGISLEDMKKHDSWYMVDGKQCYFKYKPNNMAILNELLCVELSKYLGVPTIEYKLATKQNNIVGLISENFLTHDYDCIKSIYAPRNLIRMIRKILTDYKFECDPITRKQITALILRNFYASLFDRIENSYYGIKNSKIIVPPTHDFESAFLDFTIDGSVDPLFSYTFTPESVKLLMDNNPYFADYVNALKEYNMLVAMSSVEEKYGVVFPNEFVEHYCNYDENKKEFMKTLGF